MKKTSHTSTHPPPTALVTGEAAQTGRGAEAGALLDRENANLRSVTLICTLVLGRSRTLSGLSVGTSVWHAGFMSFAESPQRHGCLKKIHTSYYLLWVASSRLIRTQHVPRIVLIAYSFSSLTSYDHEKVKRHLHVQRL